MVIFDRNVLIGAALIPGNAADRAVRLVLDRQIPLVFSAATFGELEEVVLRSKFDRYVSVESRRDLLAVWKDSALFVPSSVIRLEVSDCRDASDNKFLELDWAVEAKFLVTGDPDLLELDPWRGIRVIALKEFIENH